MPIDLSPFVLLLLALALVTLVVYTTPVVLLAWVALHYRHRYGAWALTPLMLLLALYLVVLVREQREDVARRQWCAHSSVVAPPACSDN